MESEMMFRWNAHNKTIFEAFSATREKKKFCDATITCEGNFYPVHRFIISTCSLYFERILEYVSDTHPVIVLADIKAKDIESLLQYMYTGEVTVCQEEVDSLLRAGNLLKIRGISKVNSNDTNEPPKTYSCFSSSREERPEKRQRTIECSDSVNLNNSSRVSNLSISSVFSSEEGNEEINSKEIDVHSDPSNQSIIQPVGDPLFDPVCQVKAEVIESDTDQAEVRASSTSRERFGNAPIHSLKAFDAKDEDSRIIHIMANDNERIRLKTTPEEAFRAMKCPAQNLELLKELEKELCGQRILRSCLRYALDASVRQANHDKNNRTVARDLMKKVACGRVWAYLSVSGRSGTNKLSLEHHFPMLFETLSHAIATKTSLEPENIRKVMSHVMRSQQTAESNRRKTLNYNLLGYSGTGASSSGFFGADLLGSGAQQEPQNPESWEQEPQNAEAWEQELQNQEPQDQYSHDQWTN